MAHHMHSANAAGSYSLARPLKAGRTFPLDRSAPGLADVNGLHLSVAAHDRSPLGLFSQAAIPGDTFQFAASLLPADFE